MAVRDRPDDVLRPERRVSAEEHAGARGRHRRLVDDRHPPLVEFDPEVALDPRKRVLLADRDQHIVAGEMDVGLAGRHELAPALGVALGATFSNMTPVNPPPSCVNDLGTR